MTFTREVLLSADAAGSVLPTYVGPFTLPIGKVFKVRCAGQLTTSWEDTAPGATVSTTLVWGVQWGVTGFTPSSPVSGASLPTWFWVHQGVVGSGISAWAPNTGNGEVELVTDLNEEWNGQLAINATADFYWAVDQFDSSGVSRSGFNLSLEVLYG